jgi:hypothetical protein
MTDTKALPPPEEEPVAASPRRDLLSYLPILCLIGFAVLAAGLIYVWRNPALPPPQPTVDPASFAQLSQQVDAISQRLGRLEQRPVPQTQDLKPLEARIAALEQRPSSAPSAPVDLKPLESRLDALEQNAATHADVTALEQKLPRDVATHADFATLATRVDAVATRQDQLAARQQGLETGFANRMDKLDDQLGTLQQQAAKLQPLTGQVQTMDQRLVTTEKAASQVTSLADKAARIARIQAAQSALEAGQPLGQIPNAPPALARFATAKPPTEAELRLAFPSAARAAEKASQPATEGQPFLDRLWTRAQDLVTVREGDRVIVGDPAAGVIARARQALNVGDLHGAVAALDALDGPAAQAMAEWKAKAQSLLDARTALANMAAQA